MKTNLNDSVDWALISDDFVARITDHHDLMRQEPELKDLNPSIINISSCNRELNTIFKYARFKLIDKAMFNAVGQNFDKAMEIIEDDHLHLNSYGAVCEGYFKVRQMFSQYKFTDKWENITMFQYALWRLSPEHINRIIACIPTTEEGENLRLELARQFQELFNNGVYFVDTAEPSFSRRFGFPKTDITTVQNRLTEQQSQCPLLQELLQSTVRPHI
jgi:hypothetical protein